MNPKDSLLYCGKHFVNCLLAWKTVSVSQDRCQYFYWGEYSVKKVPFCLRNQWTIPKDPALWTMLNWRPAKCYLPSLPVTLELSSLSSSVLPCQFTQQFASCATHQLTDVSFSFHILLKPWALLSGYIYTALGPSCWKSSLYWIFVTCSTRSHTLLLCIEKNNNKKIAGAFAFILDET